MTKSKKRRKKMNTLDKVLLFSVSLLILFTISMIVIFCIFQSCPDVLIGAFFTAFGIETVNTVMIWKQKNKKADCIETEVNNYDS